MPCSLHFIIIIIIFCFFFLFYQYYQYYYIIIIYDDAPNSLYFALISILGQVRKEIHEGGHMTMVKKYAESSNRELKDQIGMAMSNLNFPCMHTHAHSYLLTNLPH